MGLKDDLLTMPLEARFAYDNAVIASNTSSIPIAQLAGAVHNPDRVVGLHFFSPVPVMGLVEIVRALDTSDETIETAHIRSSNDSASKRSRRRTAPASSSTFC